MVVGSTDRQERCTKRFVLTAEKKPKCRSNQRKEDLFTAGNALTSVEINIEKIHLNQIKSLKDLTSAPGAECPIIIFKNLKVNF